MKDAFKLLKTEHYAEKFSSDHNQLLEELERETHLRTINSRMCSGYTQGRLLAMISRLKKPSTILEIGTFTGYSTLCLAEGLSFDGRIITIDVDKEVTEIARRYFDKTEYSNRIKLYLGDAKEIIPTLDMDFDLVFIDADKQQYITYLDMVIPKLKADGMILADNVLWSGKVTNRQMDKKTRSIHEFNVRVASDPNLTCFIIPLRDGLSIIMTKQ